MQKTRDHAKSAITHEVLKHLRTEAGRVCIILVATLRHNHFLDLVDPQQAVAVLVVEAAQRGRSGDTEACALRLVRASDALEFLLQLSRGQIRQPVLRLFTTGEVLPQRGELPGVDVSVVVGVVLPEPLKRFRGDTIRFCAVLEAEFSH